MGSRGCEALLTGRLRLLCRTRPQACQWTEHEGPCPTCRARRWESTAVLEAPLSSPGPAGCAHGRARSWADMRGQDRSGCGQGDKRGVRGPGLPQEGLCVCAPPCLPLSLPHALPKELPAPPPRGGTYRLPHPLGGGAYRLPLPPRGGAYYCPAHREVGPTAAPGSGPGPPPPRLGEDSAPAGALSPQVRAVRVDQPAGPHLASGGRARPVDQPAGAHLASGHKAPRTTAKSPLWDGRL